MTAIQIREARRSDASSVSALITELGYDLGPEEVEARMEIYSNAADAVFVADDGGEVIGFISFHLIPLFHASGNLGRITAMCVHSGRSREGIGSMLLDRLEEFAASRGCGRIEVTSGDHRSNDAHLFYQSCGYEIDSRRFQKIL